MLSEKMHEIIADEGDGDAPIARNEIRRKLYRAYTYGKYGYLGRGVRRQVPECVCAHIRELQPAVDGEKYMGFREE